ncbi:hypothetical protein AZF37_02485 [endosymbiont 'TC1' of Trimyema compressum]|uniref:hypothetical protein n=1 Tax=endosymbiont 'TC1' of Trimyema compressum TaxID=243899 RepID=UPI0007F15F0F|nr:hypothetical protein [endosymbiont 'TC1' of Trimyema compressum]AMP20190.1 hypothetical protein AZF37_02485 [endosymbiont 'TC1' of Trimyema compressum]
MVSYNIGTKIIQHDVLGNTSQIFKLVKSKNNIDSFNIISSGGNVFDISSANNGEVAILKKCK